MNCASTYPSCHWILSRVCSVQCSAAVPASWRSIWASSHQCFIAMVLYSKRVVVYRLVDLVFDFQHSYILKQKCDHISVLAFHTHTHTHTHIYIYLFIYFALFSLIICVFYWVLYISVKEEISFCKVYR